jgi:hypothetical protein
VTLFRTIATALARLGEPSSVTLARTEIERERVVLTRALGADERSIEQAMDARARTGAARVGLTATGVTYRLPPAVAGTHTWVTGATGSGKTRLTASIVDQVVARSLRGDRVAALIIDYKGDLADLVLRAFMQRVASLPARAQANAISRLTLLAPFGPIIRPWQMLARDPAVGLLTQAAATVEILDAAARLHTGVRQADMLQAIFAIAVEQGWSLAETRFALDEPDRLRAAALASAEPTIRVYAHDRLSRERAATSDGLSARFDVLLAVDAVKATLAGPEALDLRQAFRPGALTVLDFSQAPFGGEAAVRVLGALAVIRATWAIFDSERRDRAELLLAADEVQVGLTPGVVAALDRIVTLGRSFGVGLLSAHQNVVAQIPTELRAILSTNITTRIIGRSSREDAEASSEWLPITHAEPKLRRPGEPRRNGREVMSDAEETRHRVAEIGRLENRRFLVSERATPFLPRYVSAANFDPPAWRDLDQGLVREAFASQGLPRDMAFARARELEERAAERIAANPRTSVRGRGRAVPFETPDAVHDHDALGGRRREVP